MNLTGTHVALAWIVASLAPAFAGCYDVDVGAGRETGLRDAGPDAQSPARDAAGSEDVDAGSDKTDASSNAPDSGAQIEDAGEVQRDSGDDAADSGTNTADSGPDAADSGQVAGDAGFDAGCPDVGDNTAKLPQGVRPPVIWFWRGIHQNNLDWYNDPSGLRCGVGDTTMWYVTPNGHCGGAPSCDPDHFGTPESPCTGTDCCWRNWDDPRGPEFRLTAGTGPVTIVNHGARLSTGGKADGYGFGVTICAAPGTTAQIDTCPRCDVHSCVEDNYPQFVDLCTAVPLTAKTPKPPHPASNAGCYSTIQDVTITF